MSRERLRVIVPTLSDPRVLFISYFAIFIIYALSFPGFGRTFEQFVVVASTCLVLDAMLSVFFVGKILFPMSAIVSSGGVLLLTDARETIFYFLGAVMCIASKHFLRIGDRHIFNPNNFGVVFLLLAFPDFVSSAPQRWGGHFGWTMVLFALGFTIAFRAKRSLVCVSYMSFFALGAFIRSVVTGAPWLTIMTPMFGPAMQLYIFFMITDPKTSPSGTGSKIFFGMTVALLDSFMRHNEIRHAPLFTLFIITGLQALYLYFVPEKSPDKVWKTKEVAI